MIYILTIVVLSQYRKGGQWPPFKLSMVSPEFMGGYDAGNAGHGMLEQGEGGSNGNMGSVPIFLPVQG